MAHWDGIREVGESKTTLANEYYFEREDTKKKNGALIPERRFDFDEVC